MQCRCPKRDKQVEYKECGCNEGYTESTETKNSDLLTLYDRLNEADKINDKSEIPTHDRLILESAIEAAMIMVEKHLKNKNSS